MSKGTNGAERPTNPEEWKIDKIESVGMVKRFLRLFITHYNLENSFSPGTDANDYRTSEGKLVFSNPTAMKLQRLLNKCYTICYIFNADIRLISEDIKDEIKEQKK